MTDQLTPDLFASSSYPDETDSTTVAITGPSVRLDSRTQWVVASDLNSLSPVYERRHYDGRDVDAQSVRAADPDLLLPFPVVKTGEGWGLVDGASLIAKICAADPTRLVPVEPVSEEVALKIRSKDNAARARREEMAKARRALVLRRAGKTNRKIAQELSIAVRSEELTEARVTQLCNAALAEERFPELASVMESPERTPVSFFESVARSLKARAELDRIDPKASGPTRVEELKEAIGSLAAKKVRMTPDKIIKALGLATISKPTSRGRTIGAETRIGRTEEIMWVARERKGGAILNLPKSCSPTEIEAIVELVVSQLETLIGRRGARAAN